MPTPGGAMDGHRSSTEGLSGTLEPAVGQLVRQLIENDARHTETVADEIILDIELDGIRYLTVRCHGRSEPAPHTGQSADPPTEEPSPPLSPRESEIARMVAKGYANKTIASVLDISTWTVSSHLRRIYTKFGVTSRAAMVARLFDRRG